MSDSAPLRNPPGFCLDTCDFCGAMGLGSTRSGGAEVPEGWGWLVSQGLEESMECPYAAVCALCALNEGFGEHEERVLSRADIKFDHATNKLTLTISGLTKRGVT